MVVIWERIAHGVGRTRGGTSSTRGRSSAQGSKSVGGAWGARRGRLLVGHLRGPAPLVFGAGAPQRLIAGQGHLHDELVVEGLVVGQLAPGLQIAVAEEVDNVRQEHGAAGRFRDGPLDPGAIGVGVGQECHVVTLQVGPRETLGHFGEEGGLQPSGASLSFPALRFVDGRHAHLQDLIEEHRMQRVPLLQTVVGWLDSLVVSPLEVTNLSRIATVLTYDSIRLCRCASMARLI